MFTASTEDRVSKKQQPGAKANIPKTKPAKAKVSKVMGEFKSGDLKSSAGTEVTSKPQAVAIALSEARRVGKKK